MRRAHAHTCIQSTGARVQSYTQHTLVTFAPVNLPLMNPALNPALNLARGRGPGMQVQSGAAKMLMKMKMLMPPGAPHLPHPP